MRCGEETNHINMIAIHEDKARIQGNINPYY